MTYLLALVKNTELGALLLGIHENIEHCAHRQGDAEIRRLARLLHFSVKGSFGPRYHRWRNRLNEAPVFKRNAIISRQIADLLTQASIISLAMSLSLCSRCWANSSSGQCRSITNIWRASSFQNRSSDVAEPLLRMTETVTC